MRKAKVHCNMDDEWQSVNAYCRYAASDFQWLHVMDLGMHLNAIWPSIYMRNIHITLLGLLLQNTTDWVAWATKIYFLTVLAWDPGARMVSFWWDSSSLLADSRLHGALTWASLWVHGDKRDRQRQREGSNVSSELNTNSVNSNPFL